MNSNTEPPKKYYFEPWFSAILFSLSFLAAIITGSSANSFFAVIALALFIMAWIYVILQYREYQAICRKADSIQNLEKYTADMNAKFAKQQQDANTARQKKWDELTKKCNEKESELSEKLSSLKKDIQVANFTIKQLNAEAADTFTKIVTPYEFDDRITSAEYKNQLSLLRVEMNNFLKESGGIIVKSGTDIKKSFLNADIKQLARSFNAETSYIFSGLTLSNVDTCRNKIQKSFEMLNKLFATDYIELDIKFLEYKLKELNLQYSYLKQKALEKEQQQAIKEQMIEEEKTRREIEKEKSRIEKEEHQFKNEISKLMKYLQKASDIEKQLYVDKIRELEAKLKLLEKDRDNVLQREQNTRAGFVYIISNIGSFGENVYKIGMTRRLEPMDRVKELGSASVPFEFDVHAMIFSEDAPTLETALHKTFEKYAVNKVNQRKEFYRVDLHDIERTVKEHHNATVMFTEIAKAEQYRETLRIESEMQK